MASSNCRMYENQFPEVDDLVMVGVKSIAEMGAYVSLLEYNDIEGMILLSELSRRRIRSINKLIRVGKQEVVVVLRVDKEKGYIDLSKRRVSTEDVAKCEEKYNKSKTVHSIMRHVAELTHQNLETLYKQFGWPLYRKYGHAYDAFKLANTDGADKILEGLDVTKAIKEELVKNIQRRLTPQPLKLRSDIELTCFGFDGIDAIKAAIRVGEKLGVETAAKAGEKLLAGENVALKIKLVAPPLYVMTTTTLDKEQGLALLASSIEAVKGEIVKYKGDCIVKVAPRVVSELDDKKLSTMMMDLEKQNTEISGDDAIEEITEDVEAPPPDEEESPVQ